MNVRRLAESIARLSWYWRGVDATPDTETHTEYNLRVNAEINEIIVALDLTEPEAQRFRAHLHKTLKEGYR